MPKYRLELYDSTNVTRQAIIPRAHVEKATRFDELNGEDTLEVLILDSWENLSLVDDRDFIRVVNLDDDSFQSFRIRENQDIRTSKNVLKRRLGCEHLKYDMLEEVYTAWTPYVNARPSIILTEILNSSAFSIGTMSSSTLMDITLRFTSILDLLAEVQEVLGTDLVVNEDKTVSFITRGLNRGARIRYSKNLQGIKKLKDARGLFNKVYGYGGGDPPAQIGQSSDLGTQGAEHVIDSLSGATITAHNRLVSSNDDFNSFYAEITRANNSAIIGSAISIIDSIAPNQIVLNSVFTNMTVGDYFRINEDVNKKAVNFVRDKLSIDTVGTVSRAQLYNDIVTVTNLLLETGLSGAYTGVSTEEICDKWSIVTIEGGSSEYFENSSQSFIQYANKSQHVRDADLGEGIEQAVTLVNLEIYSVYVWLFVISGTVELVFFDGTAEQPFTDTGARAVTSTTGVWIQLLIEGLEADGTAGVIRVKSRSANAEFYVDSLVLEKANKISAPTDFYPISSARRLWDRSFDLLQENKNVFNKYQVSLVDLFEVNPDNYPFDLIIVGDVVTVQDDDLSIDVTARVESKKWNVLQPEEADIEIDNLTNRLTLRARTRRKEIAKDRLQQAQNLGSIKNSRTLEPIALTVSTQKTVRQEE